MALSDTWSGLRGGVAFLTRVPVRTDADDWRHFQAFPAAFPLVGYVVGGLAALPFVFLTGSPAAFAFIVVLIAVTGITHLDGVADLADAAVVHATEDRREILKDTTTGVGAIMAVAVVVIGLALGGVALTGFPVRVAVGLVVAAEVSAKVGMACVACLGTASHDGLGAGFTRYGEPRLLLGPVIAAVPAVAVAGAVVTSLVTVVVGPVVAVVVIRWAEANIGGVNGDVFGAVNELGRVIALHVGVVVWMHF